MFWNVFQAAANVYMNAGIEKAHFEKKLMQLVLLINIGKMINISYIKRIIFIIILKVICK